MLFPPRIRIPNLKPVPVVWLPLFRTVTSAVEAEFIFPPFILKLVIVKFGFFGAGLTFTVVEQVDDPAELLTIIEIVQLLGAPDGLTALA